MWDRLPSPLGVERSWRGASRPVWSSRPSGCLLDVPLLGRALCLCPTTGDMSLRRGAEEKVKRNKQQLSLETAELEKLRGCPFGVDLSGLGSSSIDDDKGAELHVPATRGGGSEMEEVTKSRSLMCMHTEKAQVGGCIYI